MFFLDKILSTSTLITLVSCGLVFGLSACGASVGVQSPAKDPSEQNRISFRRISDDSISPQDSISTVCLTNSGKYFATTSVYGTLMRFDPRLNNWQRVDSLDAQNRRLLSVFFRNDPTGFVTGEYGSLFRSKDDGETWEVIKRFTDLDLGKITFASQSDGYLSGEKAIVDKQTGALHYELKLFRTKDAGSSWKEVYSNNNAPGAVFSMVAGTAETCIVVVGGKTIMRTQDGGNSWQLSDLEQQPNAVSRDPNGLTWLAGNKGFMVSADDGLTWHQPDGVQPVPDDCKWTDIDMSRPGYGFAVSEEGCIAMTRDDKNWQMPDQLRDHLGIVVVADGQAVIWGQNGIYNAKLP